MLQRALPPKDRVSRAGQRCIGGAAGRRTFSGLRGALGLASVLAVLLLLLAPAAALSLEVAEGWLVRRWEPEDGLPVVGVNALERDDLGYLWLATFDGLMRFDGLRFVRVDREHDLPSRRLTSLWRGRDRGLWTTTESRHLLHWVGGTLRQVYGSNERGGDDSVRYVRRDSDGRLAFALGRCVYPEAGDGLDPALVCLPGGALRTFAGTRDGTLWLGAVGGGLYRRPPDGETEPVPAVPSEATVSALAPAGDALWVGTERALFRLEGKGLAEVPFDVGPGEVLRLESDGGGGIWAATSRGVYRIADGEAARRVSDVLLTGSEPLAFVHEGARWTNLGRRLLREGVEVLRTRSVVEDVQGDPEGNLWVATSEEGLLRLRRSAISSLDAEGGLPPRPVYPVVEGPDGAVWLGLHGAGLVRAHGGRVEILGGPEPAYVWTILPLGADEALVGGRGVWRYREGRFERLGVEGLDDAVVRALFRDPAGRLWVGTERRGIFRRDPGDGWRRLPPARSGEGSGEPRRPPFASIQGFRSGRDGSVWIATAGAGLVRWTEEAGFESLSRRYGFPSDSVRALWEDPEREGDLWVGTEDRGLVRVRAPRGAPLTAAEWTAVDRRRGLPADGVHRMLPDGGGRLWMSTNGGVLRVDAAELRAAAEGRIERIHVVTYTESDGLPSREANGGVQSAGTRTRDGRIWIPTIRGVGIVDPSGLVDNTVPPPVVVETVRPPGGDPLPMPAPGAPLRLGPELRTFEVEYTALSFADPERVRFRVLLEGLTEDWIDVGGRRQMLFPDVPPGRYVLRVVAANEHGVWSPEGAALPLVVVPRWWETRIARLAFLALVGTLAVGIVVRRTRRHRRRERELEALVAARTEELADALQEATQRAEALREADAAKSRFFAHVSHELRTPLTLLVGPLLDARTDPERLVTEAPAMRRAAQSLSRMVEQILDLEKAEAGRLRVSTEPRDLGRLARRVVAAFTSLAERWKVDLVAEPAEPAPVAHVDREQMERVLANLVSNALRFTPDRGRVAVQARPAGEEAILEVADTGQGIPAEALPRLFDRFYQVGFEGFEPGRTRGTGIGLALVRELVELHDGRIEVESEPGRGSTFRVRLPRSREAPLRDDPIGEDIVRTEAHPWPARDGDPAIPDATEAPAALLDEADADPDTDPRPVVLVVEDHAEIRRSVCGLLGRDYRTMPAPDAEAGLRLGRRLLPDLVVADVGLPGIDGLEMARRLGADPETAGIPVLFLTARARAADELEGFEAGAVGYVRKPFAGDVLRARVAGLLRRQHRLAERQRRAVENVRQDRGSAEAGPEGSSPPDLAVRARQAILVHLDDEGFGPAELGRKLAMGRSQLFERFRDELGTTPARFLSAVQLERGRELLAEGAGSVSEVAYAVGFPSLGAFSRAFRDRYGEPPSAVLASSADGRDGSAGS